MKIEKADVIVRMGDRIVSTEVEVDDNATNEEVRDALVNKAVSELGITENDYHDIDIEEFGTATM